LCSDRRDMTSFAGLIKEQLDLINPAEARPAIICSNLSSTSGEYSKFYDLVLDAVAELNRYSVIPAVEAGQIRLTALADQVSESDTIVVVCFDQEWRWALNVAAQLKHVSAMKSPNRARILVVGPHYSPEKGLLDMRNFHFQTFNKLDLDNKSFKEELKLAIRRSISSLTLEGGLKS
jgi:hypothetical protein